MARVGKLGEKSGFDDLRFHAFYFRWRDLRQNRVVSFSNERGSFGSGPSVRRDLGAESELQKGNVFCRTASSGRAERTDKPQKLSGHRPEVGGCRRERFLVDNEMKNESENGDDEEDRALQESER